MERSCRYCKHYFGGFCMNETILQQLQVEDEICEVSESGRLAEVLQEAGLPWDPADDEEKFIELEEAISSLYQTVEPKFVIHRHAEFFCSAWE